MTELPRIVPTTPTPAIRPLKRGARTGREPRKRREDEELPSEDQEKDEPEQDEIPAGTDDPPDENTGRVNIRV